MVKIITDFNCKLFKEAIKKVLRLVVQFCIQFFNIKIKKFDFQRLHKIIDIFRGQFEFIILKCIFQVDQINILYT